MKKLLSLLSLTSITVLAACKPTPAVKQYTVKFVNYDGDLLQKTLVNEGTLPVYEGEQPVGPEPETSHEYVYVGWDKELEKVTEDVTYTATFDYVFLLGSYPQTLVTDLDLIAQLDGKTSIDDFGYKTIDGNYYFEYTSQQGYIADDGTRVVIDDETYKYYEVKPIQWKILHEESGESSFYTTYKLLVSQIYNEIPEPPYITYPSGYDGSYINKWLNGKDAPAHPTDIGSFYWRAFHNGETISETSVDNSIASTCDPGNPYASDQPTQAQVFELSRLNLHGHGDGQYSEEQYKEFPDNDSITKSRMALTTDFARATKAAVNNNYGMYWTRSPSYDEVWSDEGKDAYLVMADGFIMYNQVNDWGICARPSIRIGQE